MQVPPQSPSLPATWRVFLATVLATYRPGWGVAPLPATEDGAHPGVRALQRGRRAAWMHAHHMAGLSMFEAVRLSQRLAEAFAEWTRGGEADEAELAERLRRTEEEARRPEPATVRTAFVERFAVLSGMDSPDETWEVALRALQEVEGRDGALRVRRA